MIDRCVTLTLALTLMRGNQRIGLDWIGLD
jgi:hypothetical protein